ncbi:hypothetical protein SD80_002430 [Scytonema tolypothrichoides VB-61278]|nr:hypothetical protein SD80_002430 [Scytonema tolypothrichoides VB-61278]
MSSTFQDSVILITSSDPNLQKRRVFGTGFVIHHTDEASYLLTCAHVVRDVGGEALVLADSIPATVVANGESKGFDLAVLRVQRLWCPALCLSVSSAVAKHFAIAGFYAFDQKETRLLREIQGYLGKQSFIPSTDGRERIKAWDLHIEGEDILQPGYSGSPVVDRTSGEVLAMVSHQVGKGEKGLAIAIEAIQNIWHSMPYELLKTNNVISEPRVDYTRLREFLAAGKWKEADRETADLILKVADREQEGWLKNEDMENFPCQDLRTIDGLWVKYSNGHFGFSVQQGIWQEVGGKVNKVTECLLGDRVGWRVKSNWLPYDHDWLGYSNMTFSLNAPRGHLPARLVGISPRKK